MLIGDTAGIKYTSGLEKDKDIRGSLVDLAVSRFKDKEDIKEEIEETVEEEMDTGGLMSRRIK
jgi:hypothetical protein